MLHDAVGEHPFRGRRAHQDIFVQPFMIQRLNEDVGLGARMGTSAVVYMSLYACQVTSRKLADDCVCRARVAQKRVFKSKERVGGLRRLLDAIATSAAAEMRHRRDCEDD